MCIKNLLTFPTTSQWRHKVGYFAGFSILLLKMARLLVIFSSVSRAKNHISPEEQYFATFFYNGFQYSEAKFYYFFESVGKNVLELIGNRRKKYVSVQNEEITGDSKCVAKYGHLTKYGSSRYRARSWTSFIPCECINRS